MMLIDHSTGPGNNCTGKNKCFAKIVPQMHAQRPNIEER